MKLTGALVVCLTLLAVAATGAVAAPPVNDHYLDSLRLNDDGSRLERRDTLRDVRETADATVQSDVLNPGPNGQPGGGGPPEPTTCQASNYGKTVWYDMYPDVNGLVRLRANGFNSVIAVVPFSRRTSLPDFARRQCADQSTGPAEEFLVSVRGGRAYTIQVGGVNDAFGTLEFLFDFLADTDGDGVLDADDDCPRTAGTRRNGCPVRIVADVNFRAQPTASGIRFLSFRVEAPRRSRVQVRCPGCGRQVLNARTVGFPRMRGRSLRAGSRIVVTATRRRAIGSHITYRVVRGNIRGPVKRCLNPGSRRPRRRCG
ncbi:MAG TPA: hypothetical protein VHG69_05780 [Thermoleophilaceae bacterium]|nr:hypothetical protein [Thermoleophilaceae bacterium]